MEQLSFHRWQPGALEPSATWERTGALLEPDTLRERFARLPQPPWAVRFRQGVYELRRGDTMAQVTFRWPASRDGGAADVAAESRYFFERLLGIPWSLSLHPEEAEPLPPEVQVEVTGPDSLAAQLRRPAPAPQRVRPNSHPAKP